MVVLRPLLSCHVHQCWQYISFIVNCIAVLPVYQNLAKGTVFFNKKPGVLNNAKLGGMGMVPEQLGGDLLR